MSVERASARTLELALCEGPGSKLETIQWTYADDWDKRMEVPATAGRHAKPVIRTYEKLRLVVETPGLSVWRWGRISERDA
jgi:hypothetical protein